jgi:HAD superfamily hydrolase (TIGR01456 family)
MVGLKRRYGGQNMFLALIVVFLVLVLQLDCSLALEETFAVAFDIDGVLKQGSTGCLEAQEALSECDYWDIPFVLMTNGGGGKTEKKYANELSKQLRDATVNCYDNTSLVALAAALAKEEVGTKTEQYNDDDEFAGSFKDLTEDDFVLSYTPWKTDLVPMYQDKYVLVVGMPPVANLALKYGFKKAVPLQEYVRRHPELDPTSQLYYDTAPYCANMYGDYCEWNATTEACRFGPGVEWEPFEAILVFTDPPHLAQALQVVIDVMMSANPSEIELTTDQIPIYFASEDLLYKDEFVNPRFGLGMYKTALTTLYTARLAATGISNKDADARMADSWIQYGKPTLLQYDYVVADLHAKAAAKGKVITQFFMVGDNPNSDMLGAYNANQNDSIPWCGVLVETGVYQHGDEVPTGACHVATAVDTAMKWMLANPNGGPMTINSDDDDGGDGDDPEPVIQYLIPLWLVVTAAVLLVMTGALSIAYYRLRSSTLNQNTNLHRGLLLNNDEP